MLDIYGTRPPPALGGELEGGVVEGMVGKLGNDLGAKVKPKGEPTPSPPPTCPRPVPALGGELGGEGEGEVGSRNEAQKRFSEPGVYSQLPITNVHENAPAYIHNCQLFMYVKTPRPTRTIANYLCT